MTLKADILSDLSDVFFISDEFADTATYVLSGDTFSVILDNPFAPIDGSAGIIESTSIVAHARTTDVDDYALGDEISIGSTYYKIAGMEPDGTGITRLLLSERTEVAL